MKSGRRSISAITSSCRSSGPLQMQKFSRFSSWSLVRQVRSVIGRLLRSPQYRGKREGASPSVVPLSELDRIGSRCADRGIMSGAILNALGFQIGGDRVQDCQQLGSVSGTVQESGSEVAGHDRIAG